MPRNRLKAVRRVVYRLKRSYGLPVDVYSVTASSATDPATGVKSLSYSKVHVRRAIVQPARYHRDFVYDLAFISANKDFTTGGYFDVGDRRMVIDASDTPTGWEPEIGNFVIFDGRRYEVASFYEYEHKMGYILVCRETMGQRIVRLEEASSVMTIQQTVEYV